MHLQKICGAKKYANMVTTNIPIILRAKPAFIMVAIVNFPDP